MDDDRNDLFCAIDRPMTFADKEGRAKGKDSIPSLDDLGSERGMNHDPSAEAIVKHVTGRGFA